MIGLTRIPRPAEVTIWAGAQVRATAAVGLLLLVGTIAGRLGSAGRPFSASVEEPAMPPAVAATVRPAVAPVAPLTPAAASLDINRADATALQSLPGIGPTLAGRIVAHRETRGRFRQATDLLAVPGIGPKRFEQLAPLIVAGEGP
ncbi:MAG TPA: helix-hairpin-helix domain-containing protein [Candidatus Baltobacteraceae bacterium]|nr:helix-hairpin-helix domain-containing protein [Candidatus Baltobacteraceae bacterium]